MKIIVVDREEELRGVLDILERTPGNEIQFARTGDEALEMVNGKQIDLLITEVFMEPMNGFTLRNKMENRHAGVRTIFLTGYDLTPYAEHTAGYEVIQKPATPQKLFPAIARTMGGGGSPAAAAPAPSPQPAYQEPQPVPEPVRQPDPPAPEPVSQPSPKAVPAPAATQLPLPSLEFSEPGRAPRATPVPAPADTAAPVVARGPVATPVAVPRPTPEPAATPTAAPKAIPNPVATPATVPRATPSPVATPVAVPRAAPGPVASPVAVPRAIPAPAAAPAAVPRATPPPVSTPSAVPRVTPAPAAVPAAVPRATPPPVATPVPTALANPTPAATPFAPPKAMPAPSVPLAPVPTAKPAPATIPSPVPTANPAPVATPTDVPAPAAVPTAVPKATLTPAATPTAVAKAKLAQAAPREGGAARPARPVPTAPVDPLLGRTLGAYRIERRLGKGKWGPVYLAIQTSMSRPVAMEMLAVEVAGDEAARQNFVATARAKAAVQHPHILSVYEADQAEGYYFYTHQYVDGYTLAQTAAKGEVLSEPQALQTIKCVAQGLSHLHHHGIPHNIPDATDIYIGKDGLPYLSNVAQPTEEMPAMQEEICMLADVVLSVLPERQAQDRGLQSMLERMTMTNQLGFQSWPPLFQTIQAIEPKVIPVDAFKLSAQDEAAIRAVEDARKRQKMVVVGTVVGLVLFLLTLAGVVWFEFLRPTSHDYTSEMVEIPAGDFIFQDGQKLTLPTFYIDKYEVTMAEYQKFLDYLDAHNNTTQFDNPLQPPGRSHVPHDWDIFFGRASASFSGYRNVRNVPISLDCPVFNVDYFDAYAYAKWLGRRLPTEQEWEKAARGTTGNLYPWGNQWDPTKLNAGTDYQSEPGPGYKPSVDGFTWWAPVAALPSDVSPFGVIGMAGNVSEWTGTWDASKTFVVIRGGNYKSTMEQAMTTAQIKAYPEQIAETLGFRTASDTPPAPK